MSAIIRVEKYALMQDRRIKVGIEGRNMYELAKELFPICRSITGEGVRETFQILKRQEEDLKVFEIPTGIPIFDWKVPKEWNIRDAYIENESGEKIVDLKKIISMCWVIQFLSIGIFL